MPLTNGPCRHLKAVVKRSLGAEDPPKSRTDYFLESR